MPFRKIPLLIVLSLTLILSACANKPTPFSNLPNTGKETSPTSTVRLVEDTEQLIQALQVAGARVVPTGDIAQPFFAVKGQILRVNGKDVQVFQFKDKSARKAAASTISKDASTIGNTLPSWVDQPNFWASGRLIVLYVGQDQATIDLLTGILGRPITSQTKTS